MKTTEKQIRAALRLLAKQVTNGLDQAGVQYDIVLASDHDAFEVDIYLDAMNSYGDGKQKTEYMIRTGNMGKIGGVGCSYDNLADALHYFRMCQKIGVKMVTHAPVEFEDFLRRIHAGFYRTDGEFNMAAVRFAGNTGKAVTLVAQLIKENKHIKKANFRYEEMLGDLVKRM